MALAEDVARLAEEVRQGSADASAEIMTFPSGAASLTVRVGGRAFVLDYIPSCEMFGVDELAGDGGFNSGYRFGFKDFDSARTKLLNLLGEAQSSQTAELEASPIARTAS